MGHEICKGCYHNIRSFNDNALDCDDLLSIGNSLFGRYPGFSKRRSDSDFIYLRNDAY